MIITLYLIILTLSILLLIRNKWVSKSRMNVLKNDDIELGLIEYTRLQSYDEMIYKFWIWDVEKFKTEPLTSCYLAWDTERKSAEKNILK
jgi:hypothetical protein